ncbi:phosphoenolpyruvate--protein phosphotransferase [Candidatus Arthromitus sp. SFB-rat-Yit]|uniref:phosphoenolpyruvate--protein phosphotransferase n=1 Tax=Candidatus Arthromitus sp. SFB-rat-Yit TaxID=1041504 RepID=UPI000227A789|nr:phosphoenolpyruvate--protein phosphotransferase [Candidatus Arthromitus sp. SFB-rat-Yit]BAK81749.1 phosphoenolpyruvate-protein phosphotransferase [Candidatus Arthromitus sp. SFB-rat-Yit]
MMKGIAASKGYAIGKAFIKKDIEIKINKLKISDVESEIKKLNDSLNKTRDQLENLRKITEIEVGKEESLVFESHQMILDDPEFIDKAKEIIRSNSVNSDYAIDEVRNELVSIMLSIDDEYMRERAADIKDVGDRIIRNLLGINNDVNISEPNTIVVANDLTPSDTAQLDKSKVCAFLTNIGGRTSHSVIMARSMEIPAIVGMVDITETVKDGDVLLVDGVNGNVILNPSDIEIDEFKSKIKLYEEEKEKLKELKDVKIYDSNKRHIEICGNIGSVEDVEQVIENGADGVGLFRTEFLYMHRSSMPTEEEQFNSYKAVLEKMGDKPVVIRTLDIGGDKKLEYLNVGEEMNPFLGYRAVRLCLDRVDIFKIQLRALLRASIYGNLKIMFPMISCIEEFRQCKKILEECKCELIDEKYDVSDSIEVGIMVEIPSTAVSAREFAKEVDFFSIGTNDLIQYTLACDRMNEKVSYLYNPMNPSVLSLIKMTIDGAHAEGKWVGMCGEMAGDEEAIPKLLEYGLDEFSMSAISILSAKKQILDILNKK